MFALTRLLTALSALADNLTALSGTVAEINGNLRDRLGLTGVPADVPALTHQGTQDGSEGPPAADGPPATGRGRRKATGAA
jgi:hypothetical protein